MAPSCGEAAFRSIIQEHQAIMLLIDPLGGRVVDANKAACAFYGYPLDVLTSMSIGQINVLSSDELAQELLRAERGEQSVFLFSHRLASGETRTVEIHTSPIDLDGRRFLFSIVHDVTERKRAEEALKNAEVIARFGNFQVDLAAGVVTASEGAKRIYGMEGSSAPFSKIQSVVQPEYRPALDKALAGLVLHGSPYDVEYEIRRESDGALIFVRSIAVYDPITKAFFGTIQDITEKKRMEREKDLVFSLLAHDFRSPLAGFFSLTRVLADELPTFQPDEIQQIANDMRASAANLFKLLENVLEWAQLQGGKVRLRREPIDLASLVAEAIDLEQGAAQQKEIALHQRVASGSRVRADARMLQSVVRNLVSNGIKFTPRKGWVEVASVEGPAGSVSLAVRDNGVGMDAETLDKLFRLDQKVSHAGTEMETGTGLGLLLCREFLEKNGGTLSAQSQPGRGSTFVVTLPADH